MFRHVHNRFGHYALLIAAGLVLTLPNLGAHSLWDIDEGLNAEAAREMREAGQWVVPTFNWELRTAKPAGLYWLQIASYEIFGVSEWSARFPSVLAALLTMLLTYELGRRIFDPTIGLLGGLILGSSFEFGMLAHAATPDALLLFFTVLTFYVFWVGSRDGGRAWFVPTAVACGLAVLVKGPVGVALPGLVIGLYFLWNRELYRLCDRRLVWAGLAYLAVTLPWYVLVTVETRGEWLRDFWMRHNVQRFLEPMENHRGPVWFQAAGLLIFFAPWSTFVIAAVAHGIWKSIPDRAAERSRPDGTRLLVCWFGAYLVFFSLAATKLPNYVLPLYPAMALLTGRFLLAWVRREVRVPAWLMSLGWGGLILTGAILVAGLMIASGRWEVGTGKAPPLIGLDRWAWLGVLPAAAGVVGFIAWGLGRRSHAVGFLAASAVAWVALVSAFPTLTLDSMKAPKRLVEAADLNQPGREIRIGTLNWFQPSLVFYARREVEKFDTLEQAATFLAQPRRVYLLMPRPIWEGIRDRLPVAGEPIAVAYDFYKKTDVVVVTNDFE